MAMGEAARAAAPGLKAGATITDVGSVKAAVAEALAGAVSDDCFIVPGHPIAGTEQSGPDAGFAELFHNRWVRSEEHTSELQSLMRISYAAFRLKKKQTH